jgi:predicted component of type VI protein secretion system
MRMPSRAFALGKANTTLQGECVRTEKYKRRRTPSLRLGPAHRRHAEHDTLRLPAPVRASFPRAAIDHVAAAATSPMKYNT